MSPLSSYLQTECFYLPFIITLGATFRHLFCPELYLRNAQISFRGEMLMSQKIGILHLGLMNFDPAILLPPVFSSMKLINT